MSKKRIYVKLEGTIDYIPIAWYEGTPELTIKNLIRQVISLSDHIGLWTDSQS